MAKYHIGKDGTPKICRAKIKCTLGADNEHFSSLEEAQEYADNVNKNLSRVNLNNKVDLELDGDEDDVQEVSIEELLENLRNSETYSAPEDPDWENYKLVLEQRRSTLKDFLEGTSKEVHSRLREEDKRDLITALKVSSELKSAIEKPKIYKVDLDAIEKEAREKLEEVDFRSAKRIIRETVDKIYLIKGEPNPDSINAKLKFEDEAKKARELQMAENARLEKINDKLDSLDRLDLPEDDYLKLNGYYKPGWFDSGKMYGELKRGEREGAGANGGNGASYGIGIYSTTSTKLAKEYGSVRKIAREEIPIKPLSFKTPEHFFHFKHVFAKEHGLTQLDLRHDISVYLKKMGYDGVTIGDKKNLIVVKFPEDERKNFFRGNALNNF